MSLEITTCAIDEWTVVSLSGELDITAAPPLREALIAAADGGKRNVIVDFADVNLIDSTGLGVLVGALKRARMWGGELVLAGLGPTPTKVFKVTGLTKIFAIADDVETASRRS